MANGVLAYINVPDPSFVATPLFAKLGFGWGALAIVNIVFFVIIFTLAYYCYIKYETVFTKETKFTAYVSQITFDRPDMFWKGGFLLPKHWKPYIAVFGFCFLHGFIAGRLILDLEWLAMTFNWAGKYRYDYFVDTYCFGRLDILVSAIVVVFCLFYWFYREFKTQLAQATEATV